LLSVNKLGVFGSVAQISSLHTFWPYKVPNAGRKPVSVMAEPETIMALKLAKRELRKNIKTILSNVSLESQSKQSTHW